MPGYTLDQLKQMGAQPMAAPQTPPSTGGLTAEQLQQMGAQPTDTAPPKPVGPITGALRAVEKGIGDIGTTFSQNAAEQNQHPSLGGEIATGAGLAGKITSLPFEAIGGALGTIIPQPIKDAAIKGVQGAADAVTSSPETVDALNKVNALIDAHPHVAQLLGGLFTTAMNVGGADTGTGAIEKVGTATKDAVSGTVTSAADMAEAIGGGTIDKAKGLLYKELPGLNPDKEAAIKTIADDWAKPTVSNIAGYKNATKVISKNPGIPQFLAENGISPYTNIEDGKYATQDTAEMLREQAGNFSRDLLRPSLQIADYGTPRTAVSDVIRHALSDAKNDRNMTAGNQQAIIDHLTEEGNALAAKYPDGMSLTDLEDNKIAYSKNGGFSPVNDPKVNNSASASRSLSSSMSRMLEKNVPESIDYGAFKDAQAKYYQAADYLDQLNTKRVPVSLAQQVTRGIAKFTGAGIAAHLGGGVVSEFAGYQLGKAVERMLENMATPMRASFLDNLSKTNPKAFKDVQDYLNVKMNGSATPLLEAGSPGENPIPMGGMNQNLQKVDAQGNVIPTDSSVQSVPASKSSTPGQDPATGRMMRTYNSTP